MARAGTAEESQGAGGWLLPFLAATFIRTLRASVRLRFENDREVRSWERSGRRFILAFWHRHLLLMRYAYRGDRMAVLMSRSRDGDLMKATMARLGVGSVRGSSSRGGAMGLREMVKAARAGSDLGITPDGPRGPALRAQPGVVLAAALTGLPVVPVAIEARPAKTLSTWDRLMVPLPGARVVVVYGEPQRVPRDARPEQWTPRLEAALMAAGERALRSVGRGGTSA